MNITSTIDSKTSLFKLTWPIFIELVLQMLVNNVDQLMVSGISEKAVAAVGNANQIMNVLLLIFSVITMATIILVSQYLGANDRENVDEVYSVAVFTNVFFSLLISIILLFFNKPIFKFMKLPSELLGDASIYIRIIGGGVFLQALFLTYSAILRSNGLIKQGMYISLIINIVNIIGNLTLLKGYFGLPKLGVAGVAISSVFSRLIGVIIIMYVFKKHISERISFYYLKHFPIDIFKKLMRIGIPSGGEAISYSVSQMVILIFINTMGTTAIAAKSYVAIVVWFSYLFSAAVAQGNQIRVGYLIGADKEDEAYKDVLDTLKPALIVTIIMAVIVYLSSDLLLGVFTNNPEIFKIGKTLLFIDIFLEIGRTFNMVIVKGLQVAGDIRYPTLIGILFEWVIATGLSYVLGITFGLGLAGIWIAMMIDECSRAIILYIRWKKGKWRAINLVS